MHYQRREQLTIKDGRQTTKVRVSISIRHSGSPYCQRWVLDWGHILDLCLRETLRLGKSRKAGDLMRLAGACMNGGACGLIRQYTGNLTSRSDGRSWGLRLNEHISYNGAAWLSSVRVARCGIELPNERNPRSVYASCFAVISQTISKKIYAVILLGAITIASEEWVAEVKSIWPISTGLHTCYKG